MMMLSIFDVIGVLVFVYWVIRLAYKTDEWAQKIDESTVTLSDYAVRPPGPLVLYTS